jgi:hypothetical protein
MPLPLYSRLSHCPLSLSLGQRDKGIGPESSAGRAQCPNLGHGIACLPCGGFRFDLLLEAANSGFQIAKDGFVST